MPIPNVLNIMFCMRVYYSVVNVDKSGMVRPACMGGAHAILSPGRAYMQIQNSGKMTQGCKMFTYSYV